MNETTRELAGNRYFIIWLKFLKNNKEKDVTFLLGREASNNCATLGGSITDILHNGAARSCSINKSLKIIKIPLIGQMALSLEGLWPTTYNI